MNSSKNSNAPQMTLWTGNTSPMRLDIPVLMGRFRCDYASIVDPGIRECPHQKYSGGCRNISVCPFRHLNHDGTTICGPWVVGRCPNEGYECLYSHRISRPIYCSVCGEAILNRELIVSINQL